MTISQSDTEPKHEIEQIIQSAKTLGVEIDEEEAIQWLTSMAALNRDGKFLEIDQRDGVFGHRVVLLDFDPADLERVRRNRRRHDPDAPALVR